MEDVRLLHDTVVQLLRDKDWDALRRVLIDVPHDDLADLLDHLDQTDRDTVFDILPSATQGEVAVELDDTVREEMLEDSTAEELTEMVRGQEADDAVTILEDQDPETIDEVLRRLDPEEAGELRELLGYEEESAGRAMAFGAPAVSVDMTLGQALQALRDAAEELDEVENVFVVDPAGRLRGYLSLDVLLLKPHDTPVTEAMRRDMVFAYTNEDQEEVATRVQHSDQLAIPVIDPRGVLRGQITQARIREILEEEASEDIYRLAGVSEDESVHSSFRFSLRKRLGWLIINLATAFLAAWVIGRFDKTIQQVTALSWILTIVGGEGGNAGVQTLTIMVRGMALGELDYRNSSRVFWKEFRLGIANGLAVGVATGLVIWAATHNFWLGFVAFTAMLGNIVAAALSGVATPLILRWKKLDPAQSGVIASTVTDCVGFFLVLMIATLLMQVGLLK